MSIVAIDPNMLRSQSTESKKSAFGASDFSALVSAAAPATVAAMSYNYGYQPAAVTQAAISGVASSAGQFGGGNAPYGMSISGGGIPQSGISYQDIPSSSGTSSSLPPLPTTGAAGTSTVGVNGIPFDPNNLATGSSDFQEKNYLFTKMNDANWEMLMAQVTVNEISRDYQARSNILKTKADTELNAVRNMRA